MLVNFSSKLQFAETINPFVSKYKCFIASENTIANTYLFSKQVLDNMKPTVVSSPVLAGFIDNEDGSLLGGHEDDQVKTKNGFKRTPKPIAVGYVLDIIPWWEEKEGKNFLTCFVHIWDHRYQGLSNLIERSIYQSMEIELDAHQEGQVRRVTSALLTGLCILENIKPAFVSSGFEKVSFSSDDFAQEVESLKQELKNTKQNYLEIRKNKKYNKHAIPKEEENIIAISVDEIIGKSPPVSIPIINKQEKEGENFSMEFKQLFNKMKESKSNFSLDDSDNITMLIDGDSQCIYILDGDGGVTKIPFMTTDDDNDTFALKEDAKEVMPNPKEMMGKMSQMFATEKEKVTAEMSAQLSAKDVEMSEALLSKDAELFAKDTEIGKSFSTITSMESAMAEKETVIAERDAEVAELSKQLRGKEVAEKMSQIDEFLGAKEFSVFSAEEKQAFKDESIEMSLDKFKDMTYSAFGKKVKDKIDFSSNTQKFSFMHVDNKQSDTKEEKDVYADIREKNNNK